MSETAPMYMYTQVEYFLSKYSICYECDYWHDSNAKVISEGVINIEGKDHPSYQTPPRQAFDFMIYVR